MRRVIVLAVLIACVAIAGCSTNSAADPATEMIDQILTDWAAKDADAVAAVFGTEGTYTATSTKVFVGQEAGAYLSQYVPFWEATRTGDSVDNGDGTFTFPITFVSDGGIVEDYFWKIQVADDKVVDLTELVS